MSLPARSLRLPGRPRWRGRRLCKNDAVRERGTLAAARRLARLAAAILVAGGAALLGAGGAAAFVVTLPNGHVVSFRPLHGAGAPFSRTAGTSNLQYHGGAIMPSNTNYAFYWDAAGGASYPAGYQSGLNTFFADLAHDSGGDQNVDSIAVQYGDGAGEFANYDSHFAGAIVDTNPYPANGCLAAPTCLTDAQLQAELSRYVKSHGLPQDLTHEYFILTPPGVEDCFEATGLECSAGSTRPVYCAYHGYIEAAGGPIVYANDPYVTGIEGCDDGEHPNGKPSDGALEGGLSHEHNESITDPELDAWYGPEGAENGDKCRTFSPDTEYGTPLGTAPDGAHYNQVINADLYWYQQEWSNEGSKCLQRHIVLGAPTITKVTPKTGPTTGATSVTITGTNFTGATGVKFGTSPAAKFTVTSSTSITATSPAHAAGLVDVTVTTAGGTSAISLKDHYKFTPLVASVSPTGGPGAGGTTVTVNGSGFAPGATATKVKFGATVSKEVSCTSSTQCTAVSPKHEAGTVHVTATVNEARSPQTAADQFKYN